MGVGHFFRYIAERYPLICQQVSGSLSDNESALSEFYSDSTLPFDALYLDMNGIVHICAYSNREISLDISSIDDIWISIFQYITKIVGLAKPKKLIYLAVDGVAPKAKMNQQRIRRFRSVADSDKRAKMNKEYGDTLTNGYDDPICGKDGFIFDPTCITPGTAFMYEFTNQIEKYVAKMIRTDTYWSKLKVIVSGANVPGEGEHKIAEYIRNTKGQSIKSHCIYGLDADLIMLSLLFHEPNICLLRETIIFGKGNISYRLLSKNDNFVLLHIRILREYLARELLPVHKLKEPLISRAIDDFILICMLVGNDFLPHLRFVQIPNRGLTILMGLYRELAEKSENPWLTTGCGDIHLANFHNFLERYSKIENQQIMEKIKTSSQLMTLIDTVNYKIENDYTTYSRIFPKPPITPLQWSSIYYYAKMGLTDELSREEIARQYLIGVQWVLYYYYRSVPDWNWYLTCPYPPLVRDILKVLKYAIQNSKFDNLSMALNIKFDLGEPCTPFEQLISVLPAKSGYMLPEQLEKLMSDPKSELKCYFPDQFDVDMDDTLVPWGGVTILPTIDPNLLSKVITKSLLTTPLDKADELRNKFGQAHLIFQSNDGKVTKRRFRNPKINGHFDNTIRHEELNFVNNFWFPSISQLKHNFQFRKGVNVFHRPSQHESMYIYPRPTIRGKMSQYAIVGYPYNTLAQVYTILTPNITFNLDLREFKPTDPDYYYKVSEHLRYQYQIQGICIQANSNTCQMLESLFTLDIPLDNKDTIEATFISFRKLDRNLSPFGDIQHHSLSFVRFISKRKPTIPSIQNLNGCKVVVIKEGEFFGSVGKLSVTDNNIVAKFSVEDEEKHKWLQSMAVKILLSSKTSRWYNFETLCEIGEISQSVGEVIIGNLEIVFNGKRHDIGMGLCAWDRGDNKGDYKGILCLPGYTNFKSGKSKLNTERPCCYSCIYSHDALKSLLAYKKRFPQLFDHISHNKSGTVNAANVFQYYTDTLEYNDNRILHSLNNLVEWCQEQPFKILKFVSSGYSALSSSMIADISKLHDTYIQNRKVKINAHTTSDMDSIYSVEFDKYQKFNSPAIVEKLQRHAPSIGQYVLTLHGPIPVGSRAIVTGIYPEKESTLYELCFIDTYFGASTCCGRIPKLRGYITTQDCLITLPPFVNWDISLPFLSSERLETHD